MVKLKQCFAVLGIGLAASASAASIAKGNDKDRATVDAVDPELSKRSQELRIKASETGKCNPSPENKNYCNQFGYCNLFDTKDLPKGSCIPLDGTEESKKLESVLHKEPDGTYVFIDSVEPQEAPVSTSPLGADGDNGQKVKPLLNAEENFHAEASGAGADDEKGSVARVLAHFRNKDELKPLAAAQAQSQMKTYFAQFGHCAEESSTCHQHSCLLNSPDCTAYSPEEKKEITELTQQLLLELASTVKCHPVPENTSCCSQHGYCDLFAVKHLPEGSCRFLKTAEYVDILSMMRLGPDGSFRFIKDDPEVHKGAGVERLERRSFNSADNPNQVASKDDIKTEVAAVAQEVMQNVFGLHGHCGEDSDTCHQHTCLLGSADCTQFSAEEKEEITKQYEQLLYKLMTTGKCKPTPDNASFCSKDGYCNLSDVKDALNSEEKCQELNQADYPDVVSLLRQRPDGTFAFVHEEEDPDEGIAKDSFQQKKSDDYSPPPKHVPGHGSASTDAGAKMKRELSSSAYKEAGSDPKVVTYHLPSSDSMSQFAHPSKHETHAFMELSWEIARDDLISVTIALAAGISDVQGLERFYDRLNVFAVHKHAAMQALTRAKEAEMVSESKGTGEINDTEDDAGSSESLVQAAEPTEREVRTLMDICSRLTKDDVKLQAIAMAADIHEIEDLYKFRVRISTMGTRVQAAKRALTRVKALQSVFDSTGADEASTASSIKAKRDLPVKVVKDADGTVISDE